MLDTRLPLTKRLDEEFVNKNAHATAFLDNTDHSTNYFLHQECVIRNQLQTNDHL